MNCNEILYIIAISTQLSGAILLIVQFWSIRIRKGIEENKKKETHVEDGNLILAKTQPTPFEYTNNVWHNRFAFILIALGYLVGIFGSIENTSKIKIMIWVIISSVILVTFLVLIAKKLAKKTEHKYE